MPSLTHEVLVDLFSTCPAMLSLLAGLDLDPDGFSPLPGPQSLRQLAPTTWAADLVLEHASGPIIVGEVQLRPDPRKRFTWPVYLCSLRAEAERPVVLVVIALDQATADWAAAAIELGHPGFVLVPVVIGPGSVPAITDPEAARGRPELAVLSAVVHGQGPQAEAVGAAALAAVLPLDEHPGELYVDLVLSYLRGPVREALEATMIRDYQIQSPTLLKLQQESVGRGQRALLLRQATRRFGPLPEWARRRVDHADSEQLLQWGEALLFAERIEQVFGPPDPRAG